jgi:hypothetical protein
METQQKAVVCAWIDGNIKSEAEAVLAAIGFKSGDTIPIYSFLAFCRLSLASTFGSKVLQDDQETMARRAGARYVHAFACH